MGEQLTGILLISAKQRSFGMYNAWSSFANEKCWPLAQFLDMSQFSDSRIPKRGPCHTTKSTPGSDFLIQFPAGPLAHLLRSLVTGEGGTTRYFKDCWLGDPKLPYDPLAWGYLEPGNKFWRNSQHRTGPLGPGTNPGVIFPASECILEGRIRRHFGRTPACVPSSVGLDPL